MPIDYKRYPPDWLKTIRPRIMQRANNCCEGCGLPHLSTVYSVKFCIKEAGKYKLKSIWFRNEHDAIRECTMFTVKPVKVVLTIAHLDHDEENHQVSDDRLKALCQVCHLRMDANEKWRREVAKWTKPSN